MSKNSIYNFKRNTQYTSLTIKQMQGRTNSVGCPGRRLILASLIPSQIRLKN